MDEHLYEVIKSKHSKHNNYSLAQFVRRCVYFVLLGLEKYRTLKEFRKVLERLKKKHGKNLVKEVFGKSGPATRYLKEIRQLEDIPIFKIWLIAEFIQNLDLLL